MSTDSEKMASSVATVARRAVLNNGNKFPLLGFGTYKITGKQLIFNVLDAALGSGYRSIDTAECYHNEQDIGEALKELLPKHGLKREDIFITTKLFTLDQGKGLAAAAALKSIKSLQTDYLDLYLIHWPGASKLLPENPENARLRSESWSDLVELYNKGILKNIGVSNYTIRHLKELNANSFGVKPAVNQVELHPRYQQRELLEFCKKENILVQAYCSLGGSGTKSLLEDEVVKQLAEETGKSCAQILLRWALEKGVAVIPKSVTSSRIQENAMLDFPISSEALSRLDKINVQEKYSWNPEVVA